MQSDDDTKLYAIVAKELSINRRDEGLWTKAFALENGDEQATKARYIRERVDSLKRRTVGEGHQNESAVSDASNVASRVDLKPTTSPPVGPTFQVSPWARFLARAIDLAVVTVLALVAEVAMAFTRPDWAMGPIESAVVSMSVFGVALLAYEAIALQLFGTTIGKATFGLRVISKGGGALDAETAFRRAFWVWATGNACYFFFPLVTAFFWWRGYKALTTTGSTTWDERVGSEVTQSQIGSLRFSLGGLLGASLLVGILVLNAVGNMFFKKEFNEGYRSGSKVFDDLGLPRPSTPSTGKLLSDEEVFGSAQAENTKPLASEFLDREPVNTPQYNQPSKAYPWIESAQQQRLNDVAQGLAMRYPMLDSNSPTQNQDAIRMVIERRDYYITVEKRAAEDALGMAATEIGERYTVGPSGTLVEKQSRHR